MKSRSPLTILLLFALAALGSSRATAEPIRFNDEIRPILAEHCLACHGPDTAKRKADLRLDQPDTAIELGAVVPGDAEGSELIARIRSDDPETVMPPPDFGKPLTTTQKELLAQWIDEGGVWEKHWAFVPPRRPPLPEHKGAAEWAQNPIDYFVLARLDAAGLRPNNEADRMTLARRAALDVTGLPPDPQLAANFRANNDAGAFAHYVDQLLNSPHAGEHRARFWLDAARYGDTHGMHVDNYREIWAYRDWVIDAFNDNMPFDQFVTEQIAGDLLPTPTRNQQIATGFSRCNITTSEGGAIPDEVNVRYMVDRVETTATVFLGLTAGCAVCHDHKYDPITQKEFYQLGAFFNNTTQPAMDGNQKDTPPVIVLPPDDLAGEWEALRSERRDLQRQLDELSSWNFADQWSRRSRDAVHPVATDQLLLWLPMTEGESPETPLPQNATWANLHPSGEQRGIEFGKDSEFTVPLAPLRSDEPLTISFWLRTPDDLAGITLFDGVSKTPKEEDKEQKSIGWSVTSNTAGALNFTMHDGKGTSISGNLPDNDALRPRAWQHVCIRYSGGLSKSAISIFKDGQPVALRNASEATIDGVELPATQLKIASSLATASISDLRILKRWVSDDEVQLLAHDFRVISQIRDDSPWNALDQENQSLLRTWQLEVVKTPYRDTSRALANTQTRVDYIYARSNTTLVMQERPTPARAWILGRGDYTQRLEEVAPDVPAILGSLPEKSPANRLGLAQWLVDRQHPLTARVTVNRLWQSIFGVGLVRTAEDFGVMGERPSHPELLDWLAVEFIESGWNIRHIVKLILTSATYRQQSHITPDKNAADPQNRLLARGARVRLDAEALRDQALAVSRLLQPAVGGPSVKPYQPSGLWNVVAIVGSNTRRFEQDHGDKLYRRSLYTFWKRTSPPPSMAAFNAPTREQCTVRRERTNTPLQALVMLNDPQYVEAARYLAQQAVAIDVSPEERATWMLERVLCVDPDQRDVAEIAAAATEFREHFDSDSDAARELTEMGDTPVDDAIDRAELAAWTLVANVLMNRDDFINKW